MNLFKKNILFFMLMNFMLFNSQIIGASETGIKNKFDSIDWIKNFNIDTKITFINLLTTEINELSPDFGKGKKLDIEMDPLKKVFYIFFGAVLFLIIQNFYQLVLKNRIKEEESNPMKELDKNCIKSSLSADLEKVLLKKLNLFESSEKFLKKNITLSYLSHLFDTNPKYLSMFIKMHRERSFNSYVNYLRINYITRKLCENPIYREYKISYLAEECGYASSQVFICAFRKEMGTTPILFITNLKDQMIISPS